MRHGTKRVAGIVLALRILSGCAWSVTAQSVPQPAPPPAVHDGRWWLGVGQDERSGFLDGSADCLTWLAHAKWLRFGVQGLDVKISNYYSTHPEDSALTVSDVWQKVLSKSQPVKPIRGGEVWTNPHGYYDGLWWRQDSDLEDKGFLEGYLSCMRSSVRQPAEEYSQPPSYYADQISKYIRAHPKSDDESIASILSRFRDRARQ